MSDTFDLVGLFVCGIIVGFCIATGLHAYLDRKLDQESTAPASREPAGTGADKR